MKKRYILFGSGFLSILWVVLKYRADLGVNFFIFNFFFTGIIVTKTYVSNKLNHSIILNSIQLLFLSSLFFISNIPAIRAVAFLCWLYLLFLTLFSSVKANQSFDFVKYVTIPVETFFMGIVTPILAATSIEFNEDLRYLKTVLRVCIGLFIAGPILLIFVLLLSSADMVFKDLIQNIFSFKGETYKHVLRILLMFSSVFWIFTGMFDYVLNRKEIKKKKNNKKVEKSRFFIESTTVLVLVEFLFLVFNLIQITYLFGGESMINNGDYTYAEYARKGFFQLIWVTIFALILISVIFKIKKVKGNLQKNVIRFLGIFGLIELVPMLISSFYKLYLYEQEYGFTRLRIFSHLFVIFLLVLYIFYALKILQIISEKRFLYTVLVYSITSLILVGFLNIDRFIVNMNANRYYQQDDIDVYYLSQLSYDSIPRQVEFFKNVEDELLKQDMAYYFFTEYNKLKNEEDIRDFNIRKSRAYKSLKENIIQIEKYN